MKLSQGIKVSIVIRGYSTYIAAEGTYRGKGIEKGTHHVLPHLPSPYNPRPEVSQVSRGEVMNACDAIAYVWEGAVYCPDCFKDDRDSDETGVWFADDNDGLIGNTCDACQAWYAPGQGWTTVDCREGYRWTRCVSCNGQRPYVKSDYRARLEALRGNLVCRSCNGRERF